MKDNISKIGQATGHPHPLSKVIREIYSVFRDIGYDVAQGPELETEFYNFDALNIPKDHPARDMQDTFWIRSEEKKPGSETDKSVMRTATSTVQIRYMQKHKPPLRIIAPGIIKCYGETVCGKLRSGIMATDLRG